MTLAELYMQKGREKALRSFISGLSNQNFTLDQIAKLTKLSIAEVNRRKEQTH